MFFAASLRQSALTTLANAPTLFAALTRDARGVYDFQMTDQPDRPSLGQMLGLARSLIMYYGNPLKTRRMARFYGVFIRPGDLCFDIGAHVGNRVRVWAGLGAQVIAVEPQPACFWLLQKWYGKRADITLLDVAVGATPGVETLQVSNKTPTVSTLSQTWIDSVQQVESFAGVEWENAVPVHVTTLDALIEQYGVPAFCKIDVEGYEFETLLGLSHAPRALSFEYIPAARHIALGCIDRLGELGKYVYNWSVGEQHRMQAQRNLSPADMKDILSATPADANSGDVYAFRVDGSP